MDELARVRERQRTGDFPQDATHVGDGQRATRGHLLREIVTIHTRHDEVHQPFLLIDRVDRHDVRMRELCGHLGFAQKA